MVVLEQLYLALSSRASSSNTDKFLEIAFIYLKRKTYNAIAIYTTIIIHNISEKHFLCKLSMVRIIKACKIDERKKKYEQLFFF